MLRARVVEAPLIVPAQPDWRRKRERVPGARLLFGRGDDPDVVAELARNCLEQAQPARIDTVVVGEENAHFQRAMREPGQGCNLGSADG